MFRTVILIAMALSELGCSVLGLHCGARGCISGASIDILLSPGVIFEGATLTVCRNDQCAEGVIMEYPFHVTLQGELTAVARVYSDVEGTRIELDASPSAAEQGDYYTLTLRAADGTMLSSDEWTAKYSENYPNGEACDDSPCLRVQFETQGL